MLCAEFETYLGLYLDVVVVGVIEIEAVAFVYIRMKNDHVLRTSDKFCHSLDKTAAKSGKSHSVDTYYPVYLGKHGFFDNY